MAEEDDKKLEEEEGAKAAEAAEDEDGDEEGGSNKKRKKLLIIIGAALLVVLLGAGAAVFFLMGSSSDEAAEDAATTEEGGEKKSSGQAYFFSIPKMTVDLDTGNGTSRVLMLPLNLEVATPEDLELIKTLEPRIMDDFQTYLHSLRLEDVQGTAGIYRLKEALLLRANQSAEPVEVLNVLVGDFSIQ